MPASFDRTSPTIILSGLILREFLNKSLIATSSTPGEGGTASNLNQWSCSNLNSAVSSIVTNRNSLGINIARTFNVVVFPLPVPPETRIFAALYCNPSIHIHNCAATSGLKVLYLIKSTIVKGSFLNFRIVREGVSGDAGWTVALTLLPSGKRASNNGLSSFISLPTKSAIQLITSIISSSVR